MKWLQCLLTYGYHEGEEPDITDNDIHLIPQLIDRVLISKINGESHDTVSHDSNNNNYYYWQYLICLFGTVFNEYIISKEDI